MKEYKKLNNKITITEEVFPYIIKLAKHNGEHEFFKRNFENEYSKDELIKNNNKWNKINYKIGDKIRKILNINNVFSVNSKMFIEIFDVSIDNIKNATTRMIYKDDIKDYILQVEDYEGEFIEEDKCNEIDKRKVYRIYN